MAMVDKETFRDWVENGYTSLDKNIEVKTCIKKIAELISSMTIHLYANTEQGDIRVINGLSRRIDIDPWRYGTRKTLIYKVVEELLYTGNSILIPRYDMEGNLEELMPISSAEVSFLHDANYGYSMNYRDKRYNYDEFIHFVFNPDSRKPWVGQSFQVFLKDILQNLKDSQQIKRDFYTKHFKPNIIFTIEADSEEMQTSEGRQGVFDKWLNNPPGMPYLIPGDLIQAQVVPSLHLKDIAINESVQLDKQAIANLFGIPLFVLGAGAWHQTEYNAFIDATIAPIAQGLAQELTRKIILSPHMYVKFNLQSIRAYDLNSLLSSLYQGKGLGVFTANEIRIIAGFEPIDKPEMNEFTLLENYLPAGDLGNQKKLNTGGGEKDGE